MSRCTIGGCLKRWLPNPRDFLFRAIVLGTLLNGAFIFAANSQHDKANCQASQENGVTEHPKLFWQRVTQDPIALFTLGILFFNGLLVYVTYRLVISTKVLADADRPHLLPTEFKVSGLRGAPGENGRIELSENWKFVNFGRSPAFVKEISFNHHIGQELPLAPEYFHRIPSSFIIGVQGWYGSVEPSKMMVAAADADAVLAGTADLFSYGYIKYIDTTGQDHVIRFANKFIFGDGGASIRFHPAGLSAYEEYT